MRFWYWVFFCLTAMLLAAVWRVVTNDECESPFGSVLGYAAHVPAYSNCNDEVATFEDATISVRTAEDVLRDVVTGMKWQCVEYARRFLLLREGVLLHPVVSAVDLFSHTTVKVWQPKSEQEEYPLIAIPQLAPHPPRFGNIVIWSKQNEMPHGHVAVIVSVNESHVLLAEQNFCSAFWEGRNFSRAMRLHKNEQKRWFLEDLQGYIVLGWMQVEKKSVNY